MMRKIILFSKSIYEKMPQNYREKVNAFIFEVIKSCDKSLAERIEKKECKYEFSDFYVDKDDESIGNDINQSVRMKISSSCDEIIDCFCKNGKNKSFYINGVYFKMTTCFDIISNVNV